MSEKTLYYADATILIIVIFIVFFHHNLDTNIIHDHS